jgi:hypothetical protein
MKMRAHVRPFSAPFKSRHLTQAACERQSVQMARGKREERGLRDV